MVWFSQLPGPAPAVSWIVDPLRAIALRAAFMQRNAVFQICRMPGWSAALGCALLYEPQNRALELGFSDRMLGDHPGSFRSIFARDVLGGPAMAGNDLTQSRGVLPMDSFHARHV